MPVSWAVGEEVEDKTGVCVCVRVCAREFLLSLPILPFFPDTALPGSHVVVIPYLSHRHVHGPPLCVLPEAAA